MANGNGRSSSFAGAMPQPVMPGVVGAPQQRSAEDVEAEIVKMREQLARYGFGIEFFAAQQFVKITLLHQSIADLAPPAFYLPVNVLLKVAGQILSSLDIGR